MKVVIAHNRYSSAQPSGENAVVEAEMRLLAEAGAQVIPFLRSSDEIEEFGLGRRLTLPVTPVYAHAAQRELSGLLRAERPDVLHLHNPYPLLSPWVVRTARRAGVPVVQTVHNYRHVCASGVFFRAGSACHDCLGRRWAGPAVRHGCYRGSRAQSLVMATTLAVHRRTWQEVDRFLALTPAIAEFLRSIGIADDKIVVKPNSVPDPGTHDVAGHGFLFAGRLSPEKGVHLLLEAWSLLAEGSAGALTVAGDGPLRAEVEALCARRRDVRYAGRLDATGVRAAIRAAAAVVIPSTCDDVSPLVAVEALANARPILVTDAGGLPWLAGAGEPSRAGWVVPADAGALADGFVRARREAESLIVAARLRYESTFAPAEVTKTLTGTYRSLAVDAHRAP